MNYLILKAYGFQNIGGTPTRKTDEEVIELHENKKSWIIERTVKVATTSGTGEKTTGNSYSKDKYTLIQFLDEALNEPIFDLTYQELEDIITQRVGWALRDAADYSGSPYPTEETIKHYTKGLEHFVK